MFDFERGISNAINTVNLATQVAQQVGAIDGSSWQEKAIKKASEIVNNMEDRTEQETGGAFSTDFEHGFNKAPETATEQAQEKTIEQIRAEELEDQARLWEREDQIRKETQEREDTGYQRAVADMRAAGINPNLINVQQAQSGGGIINATELNTTKETTKMNNDIQKAIAIIQKDTTISEKEKDRIIDVITSVSKIAGTIAGAKIIKK